MVAGDDRVRHLGVVHDLHGAGGDDELVFVAIAGLIDDVTQVVSHLDPVGLRVVGNPLRLAVIRVG